MDGSEVKLTVFFEEPFWVGVFERMQADRLSASKITFGAEPRDVEVWAFVLKNYGHLKFSPAVDVCFRKRASNPKRLQREIHKQSQQAAGVGTKSQQALQMQREQGKQDRKAMRRDRRDAENLRRFALKQQKRKEKHRGR